MKVFKSLMVAAATALMLSACGGSHDVGTELGVTKPVVRYIHAIPNGPAVDFFNNNVIAASAINFPSATAYNSFSSGATTLSYNASGAGASNPLASAGPFNAANGHQYTGIALVGSNLTPALTIVDDPFDKGLLNNQARVRVFNASFNANAGGGIDVYVVATASATPDITALQPTMSNIGYNSAAPASGSDSQYIDGGTYEIIVTHTGTKTVIFQSTPTSIANNADWMLVTVPTTGLSGLTPDAINVLVASSNSGNNGLLTNQQPQ
ncbi:MAG TPA: DUF4397 domain-containing protein [Pararobbsia sp.]|jgi:hypothetical protein|nr:DUF4397 domain-containing protein [Pararobbsia sp.]